MGWPKRVKSILRYTFKKLMPSPKRSKGEKFSSEKKISIERYRCKFQVHFCASFELKPRDTNCHSIFPSFACGCYAMKELHCSTTRATFHITPLKNPGVLSHDTNPGETLKSKIMGCYLRSYFNPRKIAIWPFLWMSYLLSLQMAYSEKPWSWMCRDRTTVIGETTIGVPVRRNGLIFPLFNSKRAKKILGETTRVEPGTQPKRGTVTTKQRAGRPGPRASGSAAVQAGRSHPPGMFKHSTITPGARLAVKNRPPTSVTCSLVFSRGL